MNNFNAFEKVANKLLVEGFLTKRKEENETDYCFVEKYRQLFTNYFKERGCELDIDETHGSIHLINEHNLNGHCFEMYEKILLLILRIVFFEKLHQLPPEEDVVTSIDEIHQSYNALKLNDKSMDKETLKEAINLFRRFNLVEPLDDDVSEGYERIVIYARVLLALKLDNIKEVYDKVMSLRSSPPETKPECL